MRLLFAALVSLTGLFQLSAQESSSIVIRAVLHDPSKPDTKFYTGKPGEGLTALKLVEEGLGESQRIQLENGVLNLFSSPTVDKTNPAASLAATIRIPPGTGSGSMILILLPTSKGAAAPYSGIVISDDAASFPWGESKAVNLTPVEFAIEAGEHKLPLPPGKITPVPKVTKLDEYHRGQTNFHYKQNNQWVLAAERQMQYSNAQRRVFLIYKAPNALAPDVRTIVDQPPPNLDKPR